MTCPLDNRTEWLEADGLGGFASGATCGERTRRYHALLLTATTPPTGRMVLASGFDAWVNTPTGRFAISSQRYPPDVVYPDGATRLIDFKTEPWPTWTWSLPDGNSLTQEIFVPHELSACCLRWRVKRDNPKAGKMSLLLRPLICGRDYHALHHENPALRFDARTQDDMIFWSPYDGVPAIAALTNGAYNHEPEWYHNFLYLDEQERGLDCTEDLASPGTFRFDLSRDALLILAAGDYATAVRSAGRTAAKAFEALEDLERRRRKKFASPLERAADSYLVRRGAGQTIIAGYPWFTDWGRDTFIALRGLCLATDRLVDAREILLGWADTVSEGMLPNRFPDAGDQPEYNSVDASLWFIIAVGDLLAAAAKRRKSISVKDRRRLEQAVLAIVEGYSRGTRYNIHLDSDGLLAAGQPDVQLTWMDAKYGDWVVTPRIGKPVEVQALWLNALQIASKFDKRWKSAFDQGRAEFDRRFWNPELNCLYDVVDVDHHPGAVDAALRPNQIFAVGGLPLALLNGKKAHRLSTR